MIRSSACRKYYKRCCKSCFDALENRNSEANKFLRRVESMDVVEKCVDLLSQGELKDYDIMVLKKVLNWKQRDNEDFIALKYQVKHSVQFHEWKEVTNDRMSRLGMNVKGKSTDEFINHFYNWYSKVPGARESLCMGENKTITPEDIRSRVLETLFIISTESKEKIYAIKERIFFVINQFMVRITQRNGHNQMFTQDDLLVSNLPTLPGITAFDVIILFLSHISLPKTYMLCQGIWKLY